MLDDKVMDANHDESIYPKVIPLMSSNEKLKCRKGRAVLRYHQPSPHKSIEQYAHHLLFVFYPFRKEEELKSSTTGTYFAKLQEPFVTSIVNENKKLMEPYGDMVEKALLNLHCEVVTPDPFGQQENDDLLDQLNNENNLLEDDENISDGSIFTSDASNLPMYTSPTLIPDIELNAMIRSLNHRQSALYNIVHSWSKQCIKSNLASTLVNMEPLHIFLTGNAGCGKSFLMKVLYQSLTKTLSYGNISLDKPKVLLMVPTGVAAINIDGTTIHTALHIPVGSFGKNLPPLSDKMKSSLINKLADLKVIIIDEISMVSNDLLFYVHLRLNEIFGFVKNEPFAGVTVITVGGFFQLPPVEGKPVYAPYKNNLQNFESLWQHFKMFQLTEITRQRGDSQLIDLLNNVPIADLNSTDIELLQSKVIKPGSANYPIDALHIFAENSSSNEHNLKMLQSVDGNLHVVPAIDILPKNIPQQNVNEV